MATRRRTRQEGGQRRSHAQRAARLLAFVLGTLLALSRGATCRTFKLPGGSSGASARSPRLRLQDAPTSSRRNATNFGHPSNSSSPSKISNRSGFSLSSSSSSGFRTPSNGKTSKQQIPQPSFAPFRQCQAQGQPLLISSSNIVPKQWKGWGTSLGWFANYIGGLPSWRLDQLLDLVFDPNKGLGLNIVRYNIGAGYSPARSPQFLTSFVNRQRGMPVFKQYQRSPYNWSADWRQIRVLQGAISRGVDTPLAFANAPPWWMSDSGDSAGAASPIQSNLSPQNYRPFAQYLADVVQYFAQEQGVQFHTLDPFNEPVEGFWHKGRPHEGCYFTPKQMGAILPLVQQELNFRNLKTGLAGVDSAVGLTVGALSGMPSAAMKLFKEFHVHGYSWQQEVGSGDSLQDANTRVRTFAEQQGKDTWMTEWGPNLCSGSDMAVALCTANAIMTNANFLEPSAWVWWQAIDPVYQWTLVSTSWPPKKKFSYQLSKKYWVVKQYTQVVPPGSSIVRIPSSRGCKSSVNAFYDPGQSQLSIFAANTQDVALTLTLAVQGFEQKNGKWRSMARVCRTSETEDLNCFNAGSTRAFDTWNLTCAPQSLTRLTFGNVARA